MNAVWTRRVRIASRVMLALGILNFLVFVAVALHLGGDAVNGKAEGGRYYLYGARTGSEGKGYREVSEQVFNYSRWHVYSIFVTWPLVMVAGIAENRIRKRFEGN